MNQTNRLLATLSAEEAAIRLLGCEFVRTFESGQTARVRIVETEAYDQTDAASHSYKGRTPRTDVMFGPAGRLYVYFTYGMHYCMNIVVGEAGRGAAVLIRAAEPLDGISALTARRKGKSGAELTNGPAKLCQALDVDKRLSGHVLEYAPLMLTLNPPLADKDICTTTRIGISKAKDVPWRFYITHDSYVSHT